MYVHVGNKWTSIQNRRRRKNITTAWKWKAIIEIQSSIFSPFSFYFFIHFIQKRKEERESIKHFIHRIYAFNFLSHVNCIALHVSFFKVSPFSIVAFTLGLKFKICLVRTCNVFPIIKDPSNTVRILFV